MMSGEHSGRYRELRRKVEARSQKLSRWWSLGEWDRRIINLEAPLRYIARTYLQKSATILNWQTRGAHFNRSMVGMSIPITFWLGLRSSPQEEIVSITINLIESMLLPGRHRAKQNNMECMCFPQWNHQYGGLLNVSVLTAGHNYWWEQNIVSPHILGAEPISTQYGKIWRQAFGRHPVMGSKPLWIGIGALIKRKRFQGDFSILGQMQISWELRGVELNRLRPQSQAILHPDFNQQSPEWGERDFRSF